MAIIGNLDEDGYLRAERGRDRRRARAEPVEEVERVLTLVQAFDPPGVAARSIQECLLLQLTADPDPDPVSVEIVERYFDDLEPPALRGHRAGDEAAAGPDHGVDRGDPGARAQAGPALRGQSTRATSCPT